MLHAIDYTNYCSLFKDNDKDIERKVDTLAESIYQVLIDNQLLKLDK